MDRSLSVSTSAEEPYEFNQGRGPVILRSLLTVLPLIAMEPRSAQPDTTVCSGVLGVVVKPKLMCLCQGKLTAALCGIGFSGHSTENVNAN